MIRDLSLNPWWAEGEWLNSRTSFEQIVHDSARLGADGIDTQEIFLGLAPHPDPTAIYDFRRFTEAAGLSVMSAWFRTDLLACARLYSEDLVVAHLRRYLLIADSLSARYLVMQPGELYPGLNETDGAASLRRMLGAVAPFAEEVGVTISLEAARAGSVFNSPAGAARVVRALGSPWVTVTPDFEAWRLPNPDLTVKYAENPDARMPTPHTLEQFIECLPNAPYVHAKFLTPDATGADPNYPMEELFSALAASPLHHDLSIEYEGWIPDIHPDIPPYGEVERAIGYVKRFRDER